MTIELQAPQGFNLEEARKQFGEDSRRHKIKLSFDELLALFRQGLSFAAIGKKAGGVTRQSIHLLYNNWFRPFCADRPGRERRKVENRKERNKRLKEKTEELLSDGARRVVRDAVCALGLEIAPAQAQRRGEEVYLSRRIFVVGTCGCLIVDPTASAYHYRQIYTPVSVSHDVLKKVDFLIVVGSAPGITSRKFVVPSELLIAKHFQGRNVKKKKNLYFPVNDLSDRRNARPRINFFHFEEKWNLIKEKQTPPDPE